MSIISAKIAGDGIAYSVYSTQAPGVSRGHKDFIMSRGELVNFYSNPKRWLDGYRMEEDDTDATRWGSLVEALAGVGGDFESNYAVAPETYPDKKTGEPKAWNWNATFCQEWREAQGGREVIKSELLSKAQQAVAALKADPEVSDLFMCSQKQVMVAGLYKVGDVEIPLRCLIDLVPDVMHPLFGKCLADFKTARNGSPDIWPKVCDDHGYDIQAALSLDLYCAATGEDRNTWVMPVSENVHPYHVVKPIPALTAEFGAYGRIKYQKALTLYALCLSENKWPSYPTGNRIVGSGCQFIGPESLWSYRETAGQGRLADFA